MLFFLLKDLRVSVGRLNVILKDLEVVSKRVSEGTELVDEIILGIRDSVYSMKTQLANPVGSLLGFVGGIKSIFQKKGGDTDE